MIPNIEFGRDASLSRASIQGETFGIAPGPQGKYLENLNSMQHMNSRNSGNQFNTMLNIQNMHNVNNINNASMNIMNATTLTNPFNNMNIMNSLDKVNSTASMNNSVGVNARSNISDALKQDIYFPLLTPMNKDFTEYKGWYDYFEIHVRFVKYENGRFAPPSNSAMNQTEEEFSNSHTYHRQIVDKGVVLSSHIKEMDLNPSYVNIHICPLGNMEQKVYKLLASRIRTCKTQREVFRELKDVLDRLLRLGAFPDQKSHLHVFPSILEIPKSRSEGYYTWIRNEMSTLGWSHVAHMDSKAELITIKAIDSRNRIHKLGLNNLCQWYAAWKKGKATDPIETVHEFPIKDFRIDISITQNVLIYIYQKFKEEILKYEAFWDQMDDLDKYTWIIEPAQPNRSHTIRAINIGNHITIKLQIDPLKPNLIPICEFIGAESVVNPLKELWMRQAPSAWNYDPSQKSLRQNIEAILSFEFPTPSENKDDEEEFTCGICYYMQSETGELPTVVCENEKCMKPYHKSCIIEWFESQNSKTTFDSIHGECLYCSSEMHVRKGSK